MQHTPDQLNQTFADCLAGKYDELPEPKPEIAISDDHDQVIRIARAGGGYHRYLRKPGSEWEDLDFAQGARPLQA